MLWRAHCAYAVALIRCVQPLLNHTTVWLIHPLFTDVTAPKRLIRSSVGQMYVNGRCLISVLAVLTTWLQEKHWRKLITSPCISHDTIWFMYIISTISLQKSFLVNIFLIYPNCNEPQQMSLELYSYWWENEMSDLAACVNRNPCRDRFHHWAFCFFCVQECSICN